MFNFLKIIYLHNKNNTFGNIQHKGKEIHISNLSKK